MANPKQPWSLIGVSPEARDLARRAAKEAGVPIGEWLSRTIRQISDEEIEPREEQDSGAADPDASMAGPDAPSPPDRIDALIEAIERLAARLDAMDARIARLEHPEPPGE